MNEQTINTVISKGGWILPSDYASVIDAYAVLALAIGAATASVVWAIRYNNKPIA